MSTRDAEIARLFCNGVSCSRIDRVMRLIEGTAHDVIVSLWAKDKAMAVKEKMMRMRKSLMDEEEEC